MEIQSQDDDAQLLSAGPEPDTQSPRPDSGARARGTRESTDRQWRDVAGAGRTALSAGSAARVRETLPWTADELAQAQRDVVIQRRYWKPQR